MENETANVKHSTNVFEYLKWLDLYNTEKPFQILLDIPKDAPEQRRHNLEFHSGPSEVVHDVRGFGTSFQLDEHGFEYIKHDLLDLTAEDFASKDKIEKTYLPQLEKVLKQQLNGVDQVFIYDFRRRLTGEHPLHGKAIDFNDKVSALGPATQIHLDQSPLSVVQRVQQFLPEQAEYLLQGRVRLINLWRPVNGTVEDWPLAVCDGGTLPESQLVECERIRRAFLGSTMYILYKEGIKWYYMSDQGVDDLLLFKTFDSDQSQPARCESNTVATAIQTNQDTLRLRPWVLPAS